MKRSLIKNNFKSISRTRRRFISILVMAFLGVGFYSGLVASSPDMLDSLERYVDENKMFDISVVSTLGLTDEDLQEINKIEGNAKRFFYDTFLSIIHLGKYTDYRSKSQDNHCPANRLKETNLYYRYIEKLDERWRYLNDFKNKSNDTDIEISFKDFRDFFESIDDGSIDLVLTDPPFGDTAQYFEHAQRTHPFIPYSLINDE